MENPSSAPDRGQPSPQQRTQYYRRVYKACLACRQRKTRCELGEDWAPGAACKRCQRQMKQCVFPADRILAREHIVAPPSHHQQHHPVYIQQQQQQQEHQQPRSPGRFSGSAAPIPSQPEAPSPHASSNGGGSSSISPGTGILAHDGTVSQSVMRTVISSGNDALEVLFDPVRQGPAQVVDRDQHGEYPRRTQSSQASAIGRGSRGIEGSGMPTGTSEAREIWNACRFVKQGWFSAEEAEYLREMFFQNLQHVSPVLGDHYAKAENVYQLVSSEPLLCCTILCISAAHHPLPCTGGFMRGVFIHERLWTHIQHLILRIILGQEKNSKGKTRSMGTIEALLLLTDWHPRSLALPPPIDGWDSDLMVHWMDDNEHIPLDEASKARGRWLEDVIKPAKRTGHMSWMLISCAVSLAVELGVFESSGESLTKADDAVTARCMHLRRVLYLYAEQIALEHGRQSILPQGVTHQIHRELATSGKPGGPREAFIDAWIGLTRLTRAIMETLYMSPAHTLQLLRGGRYVNLMEHFDPMLTSWKETHLGPDVMSDETRENLKYLTGCLSIEYYSARLYCHSLRIQAIIERCAAQSTSTSTTGTGTGSTSGFPFPPGEPYESHDYAFLDSVLDDSSRVLSSAVQLSRQQVLRSAPARTISRIISASIFLLKTLGIGAIATRLQASMELLQDAIAALRTSAVDELSLGLRYASLLEMHLSRLRSSFVTTAFLPPPPPLPSLAFQHPPPPPSGSGFQGARDHEHASSSDLLPGGSGTCNDMALPNAAPDSACEDWFSLPFDPSFALSTTDDMYGFSNLEDGDLDFLWNLSFAPEQQQQQQQQG